MRLVATVDDLSASIARLEDDVSSPGACIHLDDGLERSATQHAASASEVSAARSERVIWY